MRDRRRLLRAPGVEGHPARERAHEGAALSTLGTHASVRRAVQPQAADPPEDIHRDCLSYRGLGCRDCEKRCPVDAISEAGHDKQRCSEFVFGQIPLIKREYEIDIYACGLCQAGVPCEAGIPQRRQSKSS